MIYDGPDPRPPADTEPEVEASDLDFDEIEPVESEPEGED